MKWSEFKVGQIIQCGNCVGVVVAVFKDGVTYKVREYLNVPEYVGKIKSIQDPKIWKLLGNNINYKQEKFKHHMKRVEERHLLNKGVK